MLVQLQDHDCVTGLVSDLQTNTNNEVAGRVVSWLIKRGAAASFAMASYFLAFTPLVSQSHHKKNT